MLLDFNLRPVHKALLGVYQRFEMVTKKLKVMKTSKNSDDKKVVISSIDLEVSSMPVGSKVVLSATSEGIVVRPAQMGDKGVRTISYRTYKNRDVIEPVLDIRSQKILKQAVGNAKHVHITFKKGEVFIRPMNEKASIDVHANVAAIRPDSEGVYTDILSIVELAYEERFASMAIEADSDFLASRECLLMSLQLRRMGYQLTQTENGLVAFRESETGASVKAIDVSQGVVIESPLVVNQDDALSTFTMCTGGVDIYAMAKEGFTNRCVLEWRPPEKRDFSKYVSKVTGETSVRFNDKTDTGAMCAALNHDAITVVFNEDIYTVDENMVASVVGAVNHVSGALQCDDFSCLKNANDRAKAIAELSTTVDMFFNVLRIFKSLNAPTLLMENVRNFANSIEAKLFTKGLQKLGYDTHVSVMNAKHYNGMTNRERAFVFATKLPVDFAWPQPVVNTKHAYRDVIAKMPNEMRDLTHTKTVQAGIEQGRIRSLSASDAVAPTIVRSQAKQTKDAVYIKQGDRYFLPSNAICKALMGIGEDFDLSPFSNEIGSELIGQSIEVPMHQMISEQVKSHILKGLAKLKPAAVPQQLVL